MVQVKWFRDKGFKERKQKGGWAGSGMGLASRGSFQYTQQGLSCAAWDWENLWKGADFLKVSAYIMRVGKTGEVYQGYLGETDVSLLELGHIYPLGGGLAVACVEDAVIQGETLNRAVYGHDGNFQTVLAGDIVGVRYDGEDFRSIRKEDIAALEKALKPIERIAYGKICLKAA